MTDTRRKLRWLRGTLAVAVGGVALVAACDIAGAGRASPTEVQPRQADVSKLPVGEDAPVMVLDGKVMSAAEVARLDPEKIRRIEVLKGKLARLPDGARIAEGASARAEAERALVRRRAAEHGVITIMTRDAAGAARAEPPVPLYIVDGRTLPAGETPSIARDRISSVEVLKGAAAAQRYGAAGANGVILITTKK